jgi:hypothetical protein
LSLSQRLRLSDAVAVCIWTRRQQLADALVGAINAINGERVGQGLCLRIVRVVNWRVVPRSSSME